MSPAASCVSEANYVCEMLAATGMLSSMDLVEVNPRLVVAGAQQTVTAGIELVSSALGKTILDIDV
jgi:arginase family enzyme